MWLRLFERQRMIAHCCAHLAVTLAAVALSASASAQQAPEGLDKLIVYMADGLYDPSLPSPDPNMTNCDAMLNMCDGMFFQQTILGRSPAEVDAATQQAKAYFNDRFGLNVDDPKAAGRLMFRMFQIDPRVNYHAVAASDENVPSEGYPVHFGGWMVLVADPSGFDLGGQFSGVHIGPGAMFLYGENVIDRSNAAWSWNWGRTCTKPSRSKLTIHYEQVELPYVPAPGPAGVGSSALMFKLGLQHPTMGAGAARGRGEILPQANGLIKIDIVSVLTFPALTQIEATD